MPACFCLCSAGFHHSDIVLGLCLGNGAAHNGLDRPISVNDQEDSPDPGMPTDQRDLDNSSVEAVFPGDSRLCQLDN